MRIRHLVIPLQQAQAGVVMGLTLFNQMSIVACERLGLDWGEKIRILFGLIEARSSQANAFFATPTRP